jgi:hypothetical protein
MVPPANALTQKKTICSATCNTLIDEAGHATQMDSEAAAARVQLTVTPLQA